MWRRETFDLETIERELGWAGGIGFNSVRVNLHYLVWKHDRAGLLERLDALMGAADRHGMSTVPCLSDDCGFGGIEPLYGEQPEPVPGDHNSRAVASPGRAMLFDASERAGFEAHLRDLVRTFGADRRVLFWDLYNEPGNRMLFEATGFSVFEPDISDASLSLMRVEIARLHKEIGATMVYVTHDQVEAMTLADKIVVLRAGRIEQVGAPLDLYRDPDNRFVAGFIGSPAMNFLEGRVGVGGVDVPGLKASVPVPVKLPPEGNSVSFGLRPEHVDIDPGGDTHAVDLTEALGGVSFAHLVSDTGEKLIIEERGDVRSTTGARVGLRFDPARAYLFDSGTGMRLR